MVLSSKETIESPNFVNKTTFTYKTYLEVARVLLNSVKTRFFLAIFSVVIIFGCSGFWVFEINRIIEKSGFEGPFVYLMYSGNIGLFGPFIFLSIIMLISLVGFIYSFDPARFIAKVFRTGHRFYFFLDNADGKHVQYSVRLTPDRILESRDGNTVEISWQDIKGTRETKHFILLILKGVGINTRFKSSLAMI